MSRKMRPHVYYKGIECPKCEQRMVSFTRHDFRWCGCKYCYVDGGRSYLRFGWGGEGTEEHKYGIPRQIRVKFYTDGGV